MSQIRFIVDQLEGATERVISRLGVNITAELIERTPVDTGWARANWVPSIGAPVTDNATRRADPALVPAQTARQQSGVASVATGYRLSRGAVFISNNVPYIQVLNGGSSAQAPSGFVQDGIMAGIRSLRGTIPA